MPEPTLPEIPNAAYKRLVEAAKNADPRGLKGEAFLEYICGKNPRLNTGHIMAYILDKYPVEYSKIPKALRERHPAKPFKFKRVTRNTWEGPWRTVGGYFQP